MEGLGGMSKQLQFIPVAIALIVLATGMADSSATHANSSVLRLSGNPQLPGYLETQPGAVPGQEPTLPEAPATYIQPDTTPEGAIQPDTTPQDAPEVLPEEPPQDPAPPANEVAEEPPENELPPEDVTPEGANQTPDLPESNQTAAIPNGSGTNQTPTNASLPEGDGLPGDGLPDSNLTDEYQPPAQETSMPALSISLSLPERADRQGTIQASASITNIGEAAAMIESMEWLLPVGFLLESGMHDCSMLQASATCEARASIRASASSGLGPNTIKLEVHYGKA